MMYTLRHVTYLMQFKLTLDFVSDRTVRIVKRKNSSIPCKSFYLIVRILNR